MKINKLVFWISLVSFLLSILCICVFTPLKNCHSVFEVFLNIFISLVGGAFLSGTLAFINFYSIKFEYERDFNTKFITCVNLIRSVANWYSHKGAKVDYNINCADIDKDDFKKLVKLKLNNHAHNKPLVKDLYDRINRIASFDFDSMYAIIDDYCNTIWKPKEKTINGIKDLMISMIRALAEYDYTTNSRVNAVIANYEEGSYDEYILYENIHAHFQSLIIDEKMSVLSNMQSELLAKTKINDKIDRIYGNETK